MDFNLANNDAPICRLTRQGFEVPKTFGDACAKIREELTVAPLPTNAVPRPLRFQVYLETAVSLIVPKYWAAQALPSLYASMIDVRPLGESMHHAFQGKLREDLEQPQAVDATISTLQTHGGGVLSLAVGHGKTCCGLYIACQLKAKTLIIVHKAFLAEQWASRITHFVPTARVSYIRGDVCDTSGDFVIAMVQTLISRKYPPSTFSSFALLIFDEAHHVAAKVFCQSLFSINPRYTLGLTATPTRKDGLQRLIHHFLGPLSYSKSLQVQQNVTVKVIKYTCDAYAQQPPINVRGDVDYARLLSNIATNVQRTHRIADLIQTELFGKDVLVLSHRRAHCDALVKALVARGIDAALYVGGVKDIPSARVIVSSYSYVSEGFDEPRLEALVLATPASDVAQTVGRILRGNAPGRRPIILDIVDTWSVCFAQASKRRRQYLEAGFVVTS